MQTIKELSQERIQVATKFGIIMFDTNSMKLIVEGNPEYARSCCEANLKRLGVEDPMYAIFPRFPENLFPLNESVTQMSDCMHALFPLVKIQIRHSKDTNIKFLENIKKLWYSNVM